MINRPVVTNTPARRSVWRDRVTCLGLVVAVLVIYGQTLRFQFVNFDDDVHVSQNVHVVTGLTLSNLIWDFGIHGPSQWHPLAWMSHQLDCTFFGLNSGLHHATSVFLHLISAILLFFVLQRLLNQWGASAFTAAAYAVHPLNVESVAWVSERRNVLCAVFWMLTLLAYLNYVQRRTWSTYLLVVAGHSAALMSKPLAVTLPCVLFLLDLWPLRRHRPTVETGHVAADSIAALLLEKLPLLILSGGASVLTILCQRAVGTIATLESISLPMRLVNSIAAYGWYLYKIVWPFGLGVFYPHPALVDAAPWAIIGPQAAVSAILLIGISITAICYHHKYPWLWLGWLWYLGVMVPMIGILQVGEQQQADRYAYLPMIGLFLILASAGAHYASRSRRLRSVVYVLSYLTLAYWGIAACYQTSTWRDSVSLFSHALDVTTRNHWAHNNLGSALLEQGKPRAAAAQFLLAIQAVPRYALAHYNLGVAYYELGQRDAARSEFEATLQLEPGNAKAHQRLAELLIQSGLTDQALRHFRLAVELLPEDGQANFNLGLALTMAGQPAEAIPWLRRATELQPTQMESVLALAIALRDSGNTEEAMHQLQEFVRINPVSQAAKDLLNELNKRSEPN